MIDNDNHISQGVDASRSDEASPVNKASDGAFQPQAKTSASAKVGRNDPCPCGSGKKYKKCCGLGEEPMKTSEPFKGRKVTTPCDTTHDPSSPHLFRPELYRRCESNTLSAATPGSQIVEMFLIQNETQHLVGVDFSCDVDYFDESYSDFVAHYGKEPWDIISAYKVKYDLSTRKVVDVESLQPDWTFGHFNTAHLVKDVQKILDNWPVLPMERLHKKLQHQQEKAFGQEHQTPSIQTSKSVESPTSSSHLLFMYLMDTEGNCGLRVGQDFESIKTLTEGMRCFVDEFFDFFRIKDNRRIVVSIVFFDWTSYKVLGAWLSDLESEILKEHPGLIEAIQKGFDVLRKPITETIERVPGPVKTLFVTTNKGFVPEFRPGMLHGSLTPRELASANS